MCHGCRHCLVLASCSAEGALLVSQFGASRCCLPLAACCFAVFQLVPLTAMDGFSSGAAPLAVPVPQEALLVSAVLAALTTAATTTTRYVVAV